MKMKMNKAVLAAVAIGAVALGAKADSIYFMASAFDWDGPKYFDYAMVSVRDAASGGFVTYLNIKGTDQAELASDNARYTAGPALAVLSDDYKSDSYVFFVEQYVSTGQSEDTLVWSYSEDSARSFAQLAEAGHIQYDDASMQAPTPWVVPEPASGLLIFLGIAGLALRRKRV